MSRLSPATVAWVVTEHDAWSGVCSPVPPAQRPRDTEEKLCGRKHDSYSSISDFASVFVQLDRTERIKNCQNPEFCKKLIVDYYFEKVQKLKFGVYDIDNKSFDLNDDDYLGGIECTLGQVCIEMC